MSSPRSNSATRSAAPVATAPPPKAASKSEAAYLKEQAANAKTALKQTLGEIATGLGTGVNPARWTEEHPWIMLASATVVGFTTACVAVPSKEQAALKRLKKLEESLRPPPPENFHESNGKKPEKKGLMAIVTAELIRAATGIIGTLLKASAASPGGGTGMAGAPPDGNGAHADEAPLM